MSQCIGKRQFPSREDASAALTLIRNSPEAWERDKVPKTFYQCDICTRWHLSALDGKHGPKRMKRGVMRG